MSATSCFALAALSSFVAAVRPQRRWIVLATRISLPLRTAAATTSPRKADFSRKKRLSVAHFLESTRPSCCISLTNENYETIPPGQHCLSRSRMRPLRTNADPGRTVGHTAGQYHAFDCFGAGNFARGVTGSRCKFIRCQRACGQDQAEGRSQIQAQGIRYHHRRGR